jgi:hypothetical protein
MYGIVFNKTTNEVLDIVENVRDLGADFIVGDKILNGLNIDQIDFMVTETINSEEVNISSPLPEGLTDKKSSLIKPTIDDLGKEILNEKLKNFQTQSILNNLGKELAMTKIELIKLKGVNS